MLQRFLALAVVALLPAGAFAQEFYATNNLNVAVFGGTGDTLIQFDFSTASYSVIGEIGGGIAGGFSGLDWDDDTMAGMLIGTVGFGGNSDGEFYEIDPSDASATFIGNAAVNMNDLALNPTDNRMYAIDGADNLYLDANGDSIPEFQVGSFGIGGLNVGLAFDSNGDLYLHDIVSDTIYRVDAADVQGGSLTNVTAVVTTPFDGNFSQGLYFADGMGYHAALNNTDLLSENYTFDANGNYTLASTFAVDLASGFPEVEVGDLTAVPGVVGGCIAPDSFTTFRGQLVSGGLAEVQASDDSRLTHNPGFTLNNLEAPVWLIFDGDVGTTLSTIDVQVESNANTPGLTYTVEFFNYNTNSWEEVGTAVETFNTDSIETFNGVVADHVDGSGNCRTRVGWRKTGFTIVFPYTTRLDHVCWNIQ